MEENIWRRLPKNFKLPDYLSDEQKDKIIRAIKRKSPIIISGKQAKTGKTYLKDYLTSFEITAYELWECEIIELDSVLNINNSIGLYGEFKVNQNKYDNLEKINHLLVEKNLTIDDLKLITETLRSKFVYFKESK